MTEQNRLKILLVAYDCVPVGSPQALRWAYLTRELCAGGVRVRVLTARRADIAHGLPELPSSVEVRRVFAGPLMGSLAWIRARSERNGRVSRTTAHVMPRSGMRRRRWRRSIVGAVRSVWSVFCFPDVSGEWFFWGRRSLRQMIAAERPDVVIASHEPAVSLRVAFEALSFGIPVIADLGDPVETMYTPLRWRRRARAVEAEVCRCASLVVVTSKATRALLIARHGVDPRRVSVVTQGFPVLPRGKARKNSHALTLLYTGRFYEFRDPGPLLCAVAELTGIRLLIMGDLRRVDLARIRKLPAGRVRYLGHLPHAQALAVQRRVDVLINVGNVPATQIPGKLYEYLGAGRPILQIAQDRSDGGSELVATYHRGWVVMHDCADVAKTLRELIRRKRIGALESGLCLDLRSVRRYSWRARALQYHTLLAGLAAPHR